MRLSDSLYHLSFTVQLYVKKQTWKLILALLWWQSIRLRHEYTVENNSRLLNGKSAVTWSDWIALKLFADR